MEYLLKSGDVAGLKTACLVVGVYERGELSQPAADLDQASGGALGNFLKRGDFQGRAEQAQFLYDLPNTACDRLLLVGLGPRKALNLNAYRKAVAKATVMLDNSHALEAITTLPLIEIDNNSLYTRLRDTVTISEASLYRFEQCKSNVDKRVRPLKKLALHIGQQRRTKVLENAILHGRSIATGVTLARNLGNLPGNICTPAYLAEQARAIGRKSRQLKVQVLEEKQMQELGMGALLSVSRGSRQPAKLIVMEYRGSAENAKPVVLVGKGLTFDAGGISIKPAAGMDEMKYDMCGGASVLGAMAACVEMALPINLVGVIPSSENLPDGDANKPGDIVTSMSGQTIEVLNTDAEGRLILCDALTYSERFTPAAIIDIATLTGACVIALGAHASGLLGNDDKLVEELLTAGRESGDRAWQLPLWEDYQSQLDSNFADMANVGGRSAGTVTAACFLSRFTKKMKWAHLDIAGTAWKTGLEKGSTGRPVPLLVQFLLNRCGLGG
ncbi:MAG: leucyl aminopeptidase [Chromatiaceae bacterium]|nr:leucyl aminopeptidase [Gammaproteobacteria bacterium]MCB1879221.1 leucyl aminopeptidase [Gammaproteobacteria bacterium]MCP5446352.1 leucyl aminopeptidase [Chromatiaceae bacterium]